MRDKTFRALGATIILIGVALVALTQKAEDESSALEVGAPEVVVDAPTQTTIDVYDPPTSSTFEYRVGLLAPPSTDNFWAYYGDQPTAWNSYVLGGTKPSLLAIDPLTLEVVPDVATEVAAPEKQKGKWVVEADLDPSRVWSDGVPITAGDVVFTYSTVRDLRLEGGWGDAFPASVSGVEAVSSHRVRIRFESRPHLATWPYGVGLAPIMPAHIWAEASETAQTASDLYSVTGDGDVSGGPLEIVDSSDGMIVAEVTDVAGNRAVDRVLFYIHSDEESAVDALTSDTIDLILSPSGLSQEAAARLRDTPGIEVRDSPANALRYIGFNLEREPMADPAFRRSLNLLFDRAEAVEGIVPLADPAYSVIPASNPIWGGYAADNGDNQSESERLAAAINTLEESGYSWAEPPSLHDGTRVLGKGLRINGREPAPLTILTSGDKHDSARPAYASEIEATLEWLGFDARPVETDFDTVVDLAFTPQTEKPRQYDMYVLGWTLGNGAHPDFYREFFVSDGPINSTGYQSRRFENQWKKYRNAVTMDQALAALWKMEEILADDLPYMPLYHPTITEAYRGDRVQFDLWGVLGGVQTRLGGIGDVKPAA